MSTLGSRAVPTRWSSAAGGAVAAVVGYVALIAAVSLGLALPLGPDGKGVALLVGVVVGLGLVGSVLQAYSARCDRTNPRADAWVGLAGYVLGAAISLGFSFGPVGPITIVWLLPGFCTGLALSLR